MSVLGNIKESNNVGGGFGSVISPPSPDREGRTSTLPEICYETQAGRYVTLNFVITHYHDKFTGDIRMEATYSGSVGKYSKKKCQSKLFVDLMNATNKDKEKCKATFTSLNHPLGATSTRLPLLIPVARFFSKWKKLKDPVKYCKRVASRRGFPGSTATNQGATYKPHCVDEYLVETWKWTPLFLPDFGEDMWVFSFDLTFKVKCDNTECWECPKRGDEASYDELPPPCEDKDVSEPFEGAWEQEVSKNVWENTPFYVQLDEYTDETGPNIPTVGGFGTKFFHGEVRDKMNEANDKLEDIRTCASVPEWDQSMVEMEAAWLTEAGS